MEKEPKPKKEKKEKARQATQPDSVPVKRSQIIFANYNPRRISENAKKALKANIKKVGLLGGIVWNRQTGNLVSGHQRVSILDEINHYDPADPATDYLIRVEIVDMDLKAEKEQNLFMNNAKVQGEFDDDMLRGLFLGNEIDYSLAGFDEFDMQMLGIGYNGDVPIIETETIVSQSLQGDRITSEPDKVPFHLDTPENQAKRREETRTLENNIKAQASDVNNDAGGVLSYVILSFSKVADKEEFLELMEKDRFDTYIDGNEVLAIIKG